MTKTRFAAPATFYTASVFAEHAQKWEYMCVDMLDRDEAVELVKDYCNTFAHWLIVCVDLAAGTSNDVTDAIRAEAAQ